LPANSGIYRGVLLEILSAIKAEVPSPSANNFLHTARQVSETYCRDWDKSFQKNRPIYPPRPQIPFPIAMLCVMMPSRFGGIP
jgi:hypothetical protein